MIPKSTVDAMKKMYDEGKSIALISREFGLPYTSVSHRLKPIYIKKMSN